MRVRLWGHTPAEVEDVARTRVSARLEGFRVPEEVDVLADAGEALRGSSLVISAVPVQFMRRTWMKLGEHVPGRIPIASVAKGLETTTRLRPSQIIADVLAKLGRDDPDGPSRPLGVMSGPTIAPEMARCLPTTLIAASDDPELAQMLQQLFSTSWMRIYTNVDVVGVELAGALKNVIAIAAGVLDGLQAGNNAKSALLARGIAEISRLGTAMGALQETFFGLAGVGDLATSCFSPEGRNRSLGEALGRGAKLKEYLAGTPHVVEGVATTKAVIALAKRYRVEMPITQAVYAVLFEGVDPIDAIGRLMSRSMKAERVG